MIATFAKTPRGESEEFRKGVSVGNGFDQPKNPKVILVDAGRFLAWQQAGYFVQGEGGDASQ